MSDFAEAAWSQASDGLKSCHSLPCLSPKHVLSDNLARLFRLIDEMHSVTPDWKGVIVVESTNYRLPYEMLDAFDRWERGEKVCFGPDVYVGEELDWEGKPEPSGNEGDR